MTIQIDLDELKKEFNELQTAYKNPQLFIWNHFSLIRNEIDASANQHLLSHGLDEHEEKQMLDNWLLMIDQVKLVEAQSLEAFSQEFCNSQIEFELNLVKLELDTSFDSLLGDKLKTIRKRLEQLLFLNKTLVFIDKQEYLKHERERQQSRLDRRESDLITQTKLDFNMFEQMNEKTTFGKLIVINEHFFKENWNVLRYNKFDSRKITPELVKLKELRELLEIKTSPNTVETLVVDIQKVNLNDQKLMLVEPSLFDEFADLKAVHFSCNFLAQLNENLFSRLENLTEIWLNHNTLTVLPANVFKGLKNLEKLDLQHNQLKSLEANLFNDLVSLKKLWLSNNQLEHLEADLFKSLSQLTYLYLSNNKLSQLDGGLFKNLIRLEECWLSYNNLTALPEDLFKNTINLEKIFLDSNEISRLDNNTFENVKNLNFLYIGNNSLTSLHPKLFRNLDKLVKLALNNNKLTWLDSSLFASLVSLTEVKLNSNKLSSMSADIFVNNKNLKVIHLNNNIHIDLPAQLLNFRHQ